MKRLQCSCAFTCVYWSKALKSSLLWLVGASQIGSPSLWQPASVVQDPHSPHPPTFLARRQKIHTAEVLLWRKRGRAARLGSLHPCPRPAACSPVAAVMSLRHLHSAACVSSGHAHNHSMCYLWEPVRSPGGWQGVGERLCNTADCTLLWSDKCTGCWANLTCIISKVPCILLVNTLCIFAKCHGDNTSLVEIHTFSIVSGLWSYSSPAVRTVNCCTESPPPPPEPAESSPRPLLSPSPKTHPQTAGASSPSTSPSSLGAKLLTWPPSAAPPMAMQACTPPCPPSAKPPWTSTNCTCQVRSRARSQMRERTGRTRWRILQCPSKVNQRKQIILTVS